MNVKIALCLFVALQAVQGQLQILPITPGNCAAVTCSIEIEDPQCCDGEYFPNSCLAQCGATDFFTCQPGSCDDSELEPQLPVGGPLNCAVVLCAAGFTDPLCCDGKSVGNACQAQCVEGIEDVASQCTQGFCAGDEIFCTEEFEPVCCGTRTFDNLCKASLELGDVVDNICTKGQCDIILCPAVFDPVCCYGNEEFPNTCEASIPYGDLPEFEEVCVGGSCQDTVGCTLEYDPVCCNGETFSNQCFADVELGEYLAYEECIPGECQQTGGSVFCTLDYTPVCCEGQTYSNQCFAGVDLGEDIAFEVCIPGECDQSIFLGPISEMENFDMGN